jgi:hypothetical protein
MAMFARRVLQNMLDHLAVNLPPGACQKLAHGMNQQSKSALGFEWETALLFGFSHTGKIDYEAPSAQGSRPDIAFVEDSESPIRFTADMTAVSDDGLDEENPAMRLSLALTRLKQKYKLLGSTHYTIKGEATGPHYRNRKMRLELPPGAGIDEMLEKHVAPAFKRAQKEKLSTISVAIDELGVQISIKYDTNQRYGGGSHPSYTAAYSLKRNPVYRSLESKLDQLKKSGPAGAVGIFLCDGGCALLKNTRRHVEALSVDQVIKEFFRQNSSITFVTTLTFPPNTSVTFAGVVKELRIDFQVYVNPRAKNPVDKAALMEVIKRSLARLPPPSAAPQDALYWIANGDANQGEPIHKITHGGGLMSQSLKVSARKIQEVLAGKMTPEQFCSEYAHPNSPFENPFLRALKLGLTIQSVALTRVPGADDDLLEFKFGADAAIQKFVAVKK